MKENAIVSAILWLIMLAVPVLLMRRGILPTSFNLPIAIWIGGCTLGVVLCFAFWLQEVSKK